MSTSETRLSFYQSARTSACGIALPCLRCGEGLKACQIAQLISAITILISSSFHAVERRLSVEVVDATNHQPVPARLYLWNDAGEHFYFKSETDDGSCVAYNKQNWINSNSIEYHTTVTRYPCGVQLTPGTYHLRVESGKSYLPEQVTIEVGATQPASAFLRTVALTRWNDPAARHWYSGDTHLHRSIEELRNVVLAEDLNVALPLTNWVTQAGRPPASGDKNLEDIPSSLIQVDGTHLIWPRNTEYEIFTVGKTRHTLGALFVLGHSEPITQTVPPWQSVVQEFGSKPDVLFDMDKLDWPFAVVLPTLAPHALYELSNNHVWRTEFAFRDWNSTAPNFMQPPYGAGQGGHRAWIDYTLGMYYSLLNCGLRLPPSAGTANGVHPVPAGFSRVYVHLPEGFSFESWMQGLKAGRSFVTTGPMLYATLDGEHPGKVISARPGDQYQIQGEVLSEKPLSYGEIVIHGRPTHLLRPSNEPTESGTFRSQFAQEITIERSGWAIVRFWEPRPDGQSRFVHSAPWYFEVDQQPVKIRQEEKDYLIGRLQKEIDRSQEILTAEAIAEYQKGLEFYRQVPVLDDAAELDSQARPLSPESRSSWLNNMIVDHRFTAHEVRAATGLSLEEARAAIQDRNQTQPQSGIRVRPYPGGRHPRRGFLDGAIAPQRDTKMSVFPDWNDAGYVVIDVPEAIFSNLGLTYLAHTHVPTLWDEIELPKIEWNTPEETNLGAGKAEPGSYTMERTLPNDIRFESRVTQISNGVAMRMRLSNGTHENLTGLRVQVCTMLKGLVGFNAQDPLPHRIREPFIAVRAKEQARWVITAWKPNHRCWTNPPVPCIHSDPVFPNCAPGETVEVVGYLWFFEGSDIESELDRLSTEFFK